MLKKLYSRMFYAFIRFLLSVLMIPSESKLKKKNAYQSIHDLMLKIESRLIEGGYLKEDLTRGQVEGPTKSKKTLINAYVSNREMLEINEQDFYFQVAKVWSGVLIQRRHRTSLICMVVFLVTYLAALLFNDYMIGWSAVLCLMILCFSPILGIISVLFGKGWKKWVLILIHIFLFIVFCMIIL